MWALPAEDVAPSLAHGVSACLASGHFPFPHVRHVFQIMFAQCHGDSPSCLLRYRETPGLLVQQMLFLTQAISAQPIAMAELSAEHLEIQAMA